MEFTNPKSKILEAGKSAIGIGLKALSRNWRDYSRLILVDDRAGWSISWDLRELAAIAARINIKTAGNRWVNRSRKQSVFFGTRYSLFSGGMPERSHRTGTTWFHGKPGTGFPVFDDTYQALTRRHNDIHRIQVSYTEMRDVILESGIAPEKVFLIPIGINRTLFAPQTPKSRRQARRDLGIPESAVLVGSFQKDGSGWGDGMEPKPIKGPDVFLNAIGILRDCIPDLFVLLSGPARGFVKSGLERLKIPYRHIYLKSFPDIGRLYHAIDVYIVASRQEGGPKAILESMASGIPIVTTRVGQAMDIVKHGINGWMVDVEDAEGLAHWAQHCAYKTHDVDAAIENGLLTAAENTYDSQLPLWRNFMRGFVDLVENQDCDD